MEIKKQQKRKKVFVDQLAQSKYAILVVVYLIVYTLLLTFIVYLPTIWVLGSDKFPLNAQMEAAKEFLFLERRYLIPLFLIMAIMGLHSIRATHKFFGPIQRFKFVSKQVTDGNLSVRVNLRKHDYLKDYQEIFNLMLSSLEDKHKDINHISTKNSLLLTELLNDMEKGKLSASEVGNRINEVLNSLKTLASMTESPTATS